MGSWQTAPLTWNLQFLQQALFLSLNKERRWIREAELDQGGGRQAEGTRVPALGSVPQPALLGAAAVRVVVQQARVALLALLHPGVPAHVDVPLLEAGRRFGAQPLHDGALAAVGEKLKERRVGWGWGWGGIERQVSDEPKIRFVSGENGGVRRRVQAPCCWRGLRSRRWGTSRTSRPGPPAGRSMERCPGRAPLRSCGPARESSPGPLPAGVQHTRHYRAGRNQVQWAKPSDLQDPQTTRDKMRRRIHRISFLKILFANYDGK